MKARVWIGSAIALLAIGTLAWLATLPSSRDSKAERPAPAPAMTVTTALPQRERWPAQVEANGSVAAWQEALIGAQLGGLRLEEVYVDVGDMVRRGQLLAVFAGETLLAERAELAAAVAEAQAAARQAEANRERALKVGSSGALSQQQVQAYITEADVALARIESARSRLHSKDLQLRFARVVAPDDGVISSRSATVGSVAQPGQELFRLVRQSRLEWRAELTSQQVPRIKAGQTAVLVLPDGSELTGTVRQIAPTMDERSRLALVYVDLPAGSTARAGMYLPGRLELGSSDTLVVPAASVVTRDGRSIVFAIEQADGVARVAGRRVELGRRIGNRVEITGGVDEGDALVVEGAGFLNDGDVVRIVAAGA